MGRSQFQSTFPRKLRVGVGQVKAFGTAMGEAALSPPCRAPSLPWNLQSHPHPHPKVKENPSSGLTSHTFSWDLITGQVLNPSLPQEMGFAQSTNKSRKLQMTPHPRLDPRLCMMICMLFLCFQGRRRSKMTWRRSRRIYMTTWLI